MKQLLERNIGLLVALVLFSQHCLATTTTPDAEQPLKIESSTVEFDDQQGIATYIGDVIAKQGSRQLTADKLVIYRGKDTKIELIIATGNPAHFQSQANPAKPIGYGTADTIKYFPDKDKVYLIKNASLEQGGDIIKGYWLIYFFQTGLLKSKPSVHQRTTVILPPKNKNL